MANGRRPSREQRREQIVNATIALVAEHGVRGTSLVRIASELGITYPSLYAHFANKREILIAALDVLIEEIQVMHRASFRDNAVDHLREIGHAHSRLVASAEDGFVLPLFEFIAAAPKEDLREILGAREIMLVEDLADIARRGQRDGTIIAEADPEQIAWMMVSRAWTEDIAALMGLRAHWTEERSRRMLELILRSITAPGGRPNAEH
jgi:AcrR family transcriptional regulator